jgi:hypothetical protein
MDCDKSQRDPNKTLLCRKDRPALVVVPTVGVVLKSLLNTTRAHNHPTNSGHLSSMQAGNMCSHLIVIYIAVAVMRAAWHPLTHSGALLEEKIPSPFKQVDMDKKAPL